jgi:predicted MFS family arabinose efflux permease
LNVAGRWPHPFLFAMPRMAGTFSHTALFVLTLPLLLLQTVGPEHKGFHLAFINCSASFISLFLLWLAGSYVDRQLDGSRNRWLVSCTLFFALAPLAMISFVQGYAVLAIALIAVFLARVVTDAGLLATLTDDETLRPRESFTAPLIIMHFLGSVLGAVAFGLFPLSVPIGRSLHFLPAGGAAFAMTCMALFCFLQATKKSSRTGRPTPPQSVRLALTSDFKYFLVARSCFLAGILVVPLFLVFMVGDLMMAEDVRRTSAELMACLLVGGLLSSSVSGYFVRKIGEISLLLQVGLVLALIAPIFLVTLPRSDLLAMVCMIVFGAGFGAIMVAGTSLSIKLTADTGMSGRYMALVTMSTFLSQFLASASGGMVLDPLNQLGDNLGYWGLLVVVELFFFSGRWALQGIKS